MAHTDGQWLSAQWDKENACHNELMSRLSGQVHAWIAAAASKPHTGSACCLVLALLGLALRVVCSSCGQDRMLPGYVMAYVPQCTTEVAEPQSIRIYIPHQGRWAAGGCLAKWLYPSISLQQGCPPHLGWLGPEGRQHTFDGHGTGIMQQQCSACLPGALAAFRAVMCCLPSPGYP